MNIFLKLAARRTLKATEEEVAAMLEALDVDEYREILDGENCHGIEIGYCCSCEKVFVFSENLDFDWRETVPKRFLALLGSLIAKNGLDYLTLGECTSGGDEIHTGSEWGNEVRIRADGSIWDPKLVWEKPPNRTVDENQ